MFIASSQNSKRMKHKRACLVINPRDGQNVTNITAIIAVLSAAGWKTDIALKEYGGQSIELASRAAEEGYDLVLGYGGDGTLNQVLNGVMKVKKRRSVIGVIPGGTANVWATEIGVPHDPLKAVLALLESEARTIDIGYVEVQGLTLPEADQQKQDEKPSQKSRKAQKKGAKSKALHHFLLMAGLGLDAAIMEHSSDALKHHFGPLAVGLSAVKELPALHPFPVEIRVCDAEHGDVVWKGEALQIVIGNTRHYANIVQITPDAYLDDGMIDVCVIKPGDPLTGIEQISSLLLRQKPNHETTEYFHGPSIVISVPASIELQLDGSTKNLKDYLSKTDRQALQRTGNNQQVMVNYRFAALSRAAQVTIPHTYHGDLFRQPLAEELRPEAAQQRNGTHEQLQDHSGEDTQRESPERISTLLEQGRQVSVTGVLPQPDQVHHYIIAGTVHKRGTGDTQPVAIQVIDQTCILRHTGEQVAPVALQDLHEGAAIVVAGKKSKRNVILATHVLI
ncbi:MAG: diacylglycerol kinase family lipid kinase [Chloroflexi bacterium]|nr:MAG: diacylglycerol kinase family lipid kinase [Chloroflexota bacterium]